jgi:hypothetical protein
MIDGTHQSRTFWRRPKGVPRRGSLFLPSVAARVRDRRGQYRDRKQRGPVGGVTLYYWSA